jgi:prolipoprotein diacylglyceryl transferase
VPKVPGGPRGSRTIRRVSGAALVASIPAPDVRDITLGPLDIRLYALCLLAGIAAAVWISMRRWRAVGGDPDLVLEVALWSVLAGLIGGRLYHDLTSWNEVGDEWYGPIAIWQGGLGIWGGVLFGVLTGAYVTHRRGASVLAMMDAAAPGILVAQGIGRLGNYFNQELFGGPSDQPWALEVDLQHRPEQYINDTTFHPTFLYEMLWNFGGAALIIWLGHRFRLRPPGVFCLYVAIYSLGRIFWEQLRVDPSKMFLGQRLNFYVALVLLIGAIVAFVWSVRRGPLPVESAPAAPAPAPAPAPGVPRTPGGSRARPAKPPRRRR